MMSGLKQLCKLYGNIEVNGILWIWDYATDQPRIKSEMTKEEINACKKAKKNK